MDINFTNHKFSIPVVLIRGGGEKASAIAYRLHRCRFRVLITEIEFPGAERRGVSFCEAIYKGVKEVEGVIAKKVNISTFEINSTWQENKIPIVVDPENKARNLILPDILVDSIMAKKNLGTKISDASLVIGVGPGFKAGYDAHLVVETNPASHDLGKVKDEGTTEAHNHIPLRVFGMDVERIFRSPQKGILRLVRDIGDVASKGQIIGRVESYPIMSPISGVIWGIMRDGSIVKKNQKLGDIDPRGKSEYCFSIAPQALAIAGGVLEAIIGNKNCFF
ncbi:MAG: selenium-dependent molybdenum cofactor biosynthesis protein YqeB [Thermodesulfobacteriota bacterium]|nr:selenium-dependent molybdenum cofactor biosynthesis protein YqeB [Thermodesulfobacteriota bacterium]